MGIQPPANPVAKLSALPRKVCVLGEYRMTEVCPSEAHVTPMNTSSPLIPRPMGRSSAFEAHGTSFVLIAGLEIRLGTALSAIGAGGEPTSGT